MHTYRQLFCSREFRILFTVVSTRYAGLTMAGFALSTLIYARTGSPLMSAVAMFGSSIMQATGGAVLLAWADRLPPRAALTALGIVFAALTLVLAAPIPAVVLLLVALVPGR